MKLSLVIPFYNEEDNIERVEKEITSALDDIEILDDYEVICVEDGSSDQTLQRLKQIKNPRFKIYQHTKNYGLTAAIYTGIKAAIFDIVGYIDADLQTDPRDLGKLLLEIEKGYDCASGTRQKQKIHFIRKLSSGIGHIVPMLFLGTKLRDTNCPLKVFKKKCIQDLTFYENFHRILSYLFEMQGFRVSEIPIEHYPRLAGESKFGFGVRKRFIEGIGLMYVARWMKKNRIDTRVVNS